MQRRKSIFILHRKIEAILVKNALKFLQIAIAKGDEQLVDERRLLGIDRLGQVVFCKIPLVHDVATVKC